MRGERSSRFGRSPRSGRSPNERSCGRPSLRNGFARGRSPCSRGSRSLRGRSPNERSPRGGRSPRFGRSPRSGRSPKERLRSKPSSSPRGLRTTSSLERIHSPSASRARLTCGRGAACGRSKLPLCGRSSRPRRVSVFGVLGGFRGCLFAERPCARAPSRRWRCAATREPDAFGRSSSLRPPSLAAVLAVGFPAIVALGIEAAQRTLALVAGLFPTLVLALRRAFGFCRSCSATSSSASSAAIAGAL